MSHSSIPTHSSSNSTIGHSNNQRHANELQKEIEDTQFNGKMQEEETFKIARAANSCEHKSNETQEN